MTNPTTRFARPCSLIVAACLALALAACDGGLTDAATTAVGDDAFGKPEKAELCHKVAENVYYYVEVGANGAGPHLAHGDVPFIDDASYTDPSGEYLYCEPEPEVECPCYAAEDLAAVAWSCLSVSSPPYAHMLIGDGNSAGSCRSLSGYCGAPYSVCTYNVGETQIEITGLNDEQIDACRALVHTEAQKQSLEPC